MGDSDGGSLGRREGSVVGSCVGFSLGEPLEWKKTVGSWVGFRVGSSLGRVVGERVGCLVGVRVGSSVGLKVGESEGASKGDNKEEGLLGAGAGESVASV